MKLNYKLTASTVILFAIGGSLAEARTSFDSTATTQFDIAGLPAGVTASGSFVRADPEWESISAVDADFNELDQSQYAINPDDASATLSLGGSHSFSVNGYADSGKVTSFNVGWYQFDFYNDSGSQQQIALNIGYDFSYSTQGSFADSYFNLNLWTYDDFLNDMSLAIAASSGNQMYAESTDAAVEVAGDFKSMLYRFVLAPGESKSVYADVGITGILEPAAVPLPAAGWLFAFGIMALRGFGKRKIPFVGS